MASENKEYIRLPLLPLRGLHVFPGMLLTFDVERPASVASVNLAVKNDQLIFLAAQKALQPILSRCIRASMHCLAFSVQFLSVNPRTAVAFFEEFVPCHQPFL